jgi:hypothetical protein
MSSRFRPSAYPAHWPALRQAVLARAAYTCECRGECGSVHPQGRCTVPHLAWVVRDPDDPARWHVVVSPASGTIRIVLAVAHLCQDSACANLTCLRGLCQRCHLRYDHAQQWRTRRRNHRIALEGAGQQCLWPVEGWGEVLPPRPLGRPDPPCRGVTVHLGFPTTQSV